MNQKMSSIDLNKIRKINKFLIGMYITFFLVMNVIAGGNEGPAIIPLLSVAFYAVTGFVFGLIELPILIVSLILSKKKKLFLGIGFTVIFTLGSVYLCFFSNFTL
jgi:uncharacterized membrane protein YqjE